MAFGIKREELQAWKEKVERGEIAIITHYWLTPKFPEAKTVTKVGCSNISKLKEWGRKYGLQPHWIHDRDQYPHYDVFEDIQIEVLRKEGYAEQIERFRLENKKT